MTAALILNVALAAFIVITILSLLRWGIVKDRQQRRMGPPAEGI